MHGAYIRVSRACKSVYDLRVSNSPEHSEAPSGRRLLFLAFSPLIIRATCPYQMCHYSVKTAKSDR